jgi:hypothetical protein
MRFRRSIATVALGLGLCAIPAVAFAASPTATPSATSSPSTTPAPTAVDLGVEAGSPSYVLRPATTTQVSFTVANEGSASASGRTLDVVIPLLQHGVVVTHSSLTCSFTAANATVSCPLSSLAVGASQIVTLTLDTPAVTDLDPGTSDTGTGSASISPTAPADADPTNDSAPFALTLRVPPPPSATAVRGTVVDALTGVGVTGAHITVTDHAGHVNSGLTTSRGSFEVRPTTGQTLEPGKVTVTVEKSGYAKVGTVVLAIDGRAVSGVKVAAHRATAHSAPESAAGPTGAPSPSPMAVATHADALRDAAIKDREQRRDRMIVAIAAASLGSMFLLACVVGLAAMMLRRLRRLRRLGRLGRRTASPAAPRFDEDLTILLP